MKNFSLEEFLKDPTRKVVTRDGKIVKIIDTNAPDERDPIVGYIFHKGEWNGPWAWHRDGSYKKDGDDMDLFFADEEPETIDVPFGAKDSEFIKDEYFIPEGCEARIEGNKVIIEKIQKEEELTEFEKELRYWIVQSLCNYENNGCVSDNMSDSVNIYLKDASKKLLDLARKELEREIGDKCWEAHLKGEEEALKTMPKWKKITDQNQRYLAYGFFSWNDYYLSIQELKDKLSKEE